jgi:hypothetical protein
MVVGASGLVLVYTAPEYSSSGIHGAFDQFLTLKVFGSILNCPDRAGFFRWLLQRDIKSSSYFEETVPGDGLRLLSRVSGVEEDYLSN